MKRLGLLLIVLISSLNGFSQNGKDSLKGPEFSFPKKMHDFGDIIQGDKVTHVFQFKNTGDEPLKIQRVESGCSCTPTIGDTSRYYQPGETGEIKVTFDSETKPGAIPKQGIIQKRITILSNSRKKIDFINIRMNVLPPPNKPSKSQ